MRLLSRIIRPATGLFERFVPILAVTSLVASAQTADSRPGAAPAVQSPATVTLPPYAITSQTAGDRVNPLSQPTSGILGDGRTLLDTPRAATTLTPDLLAQQGITSLPDLAAYAPSTYAPASYGLLTTPMIRGDTAETYLNGQRLSYSNYGYLPSFNNVGSVDLVRGPGSAVFGAGQQLGGYVNYVTKAPSFDGPHTIVTAQLGTFVPDGGAYAHGSVQIDTTAPINDRLAWRFSYEGQGGDTFYQRNGVKDDREDFFGTLTWKPAPGLRIEANAQFMWQDTPESIGVNRITQDLIDHGIYLSGNPLSPVPVSLPRDVLLFSRGDFSSATIVRGQVIITKEVSPALTLVNRSLYEHVDRQRFNAFEYVEQVRQDTMDNRTEVHWSFDALGRPGKVITGVALRYEGVHSLVGYNNVPDLGIPGNSDGVGDYSFYDITDPSRIFAAAPITGSSHQIDNATNSDTVASHVLNPALFWQQEVNVTKTLLANVGWREDFYHVTAHDPIPAGAGGSGFADSLNTAAFSQAYSLLWKAQPALSFYLTHQRVSAAQGSTTGGGVNLGSGAIDPEDFHNQSVLTEAGAKADLLDHRLYASAAVFQQDRHVRDLAGNLNNIRVRGLELESVWSPVRDLNIFANATWQMGHYVDSAPYESSTGGGFTPGDAPAPGNWALTGFSHLLLNGGLRQRLGSGLGFGFEAQWQSRQNVNIPVAPTDPQLVIPAQLTLNASVFYEAKRWSATINFLNLTNARNWIHNGDAYDGAGLISQSLPLRVEARVTVRF